MALIISKKAEKSLEKKDKRVAVTAPPPPVKHRDTVQPSSTDPSVSLVAALWALPGRKGETLMIRKKSTGKILKVVSYNPATRLLTLAHPEKYAESGEFKFETTVTQQTEELYEPWWR